MLYCWIPMGRCYYHYLGKDKGEWVYEITAMCKKKVVGINGKDIVYQRIDAHRRRRANNRRISPKLVSWSRDDALRRSPNLVVDGEGAYVEDTRRE